MGTVINKPGGGGGSSPAFKGFKYNVSINTSGVAPATAPGQAIIWYEYYNDGESSGYTLRGISMDPIDADGNSVGAFIQNMNLQPCPITNSLGDYKGYIYYGIPTYVSVGSYYSILTQNITLPYDNSGDYLFQSGVYYFSLQTSNVASQPVLVSGTNIKTVNSTSLLGSGNLNTPKGSHVIYGTPNYAYSNTVNASSTGGTLAVANQTATFTAFTPVKTFTASSFSIQIIATPGGIQAGGWLGVYTASSEGQIGGIITRAQQYTAQLNLITSTPGIFTVAEPFQFQAGVTYWIGWNCYLLATGSATVATYDTKAMLPITSGLGVVQNIGYNVTGATMNQPYGPDTINLNTIGTLTTNCTQVWFNIGSTP